MASSGIIKEPAQGPPAACCPRMAQGTVIHVAPEQPTHAVCVVGTETPLDVCG